MDEQALIRMALAQARDSVLYKRLIKRNFRQHRGYASFKTIANTIAMSLKCSSSGVAPRLFKEDKTYTNSIIACWLACDDPIFPVYAIKQDLAEHVQKQKLPRNIGQLEKVFNVGMFLLPQGLITNPDEYSVDWILIIHFDNPTFEKSLERFYQFLGGTVDAETSVTLDIAEGQRKVMWATNLSNTVFYNNNLELPKKGKPIIGEFEIYGDLKEKDNISVERKFTDKIDNLVLQILWHMQQPREVVEPAPIRPNSMTSQRHGFGKESALEPIWIGLDTPPILVKKPHQGGTHASPVEHPRGGHPRRQRYGKGRQEVKMIYVKPTIVNRKKDEETN